MKPKNLNTQHERNHAPKTIKNPFSTEHDTIQIFLKIKLWDSIKGSNFNSEFEKGDNLVVQKMQHPQKTKNTNEMGNAP